MRSINLVFVFLLMFASQAFATNECKHVVFAEVEIACLRHGVGSFSETERASAILDRLGALSKNQTFDPDKLLIVDQESSTEIVSEDVVIMSLRKEDLNPTDNEKTLHDLAAAVTSNMKAAIIRDRQIRSPQEFLRGAIYTLIATFAFSLLLFGLLRLYRKIYAAIRAGTNTYIPGLKVQAFEILSSLRLVEVLIWFSKLSRILVTLIATYFYIPLVFGFFPATANLAPKLYGFILGPLHRIFDVFVNFIPNLFFIFIIGLITNYLLNLVKFFFREIELETLRFNGFYKEWAEPTYKLVRILIIAFAVVMAFPYIPGSSSPAFQGVTVFLGILVSLGSSSAIGNIVAGIVLTYMRPFKVGDRVEIAGTVGDVVERTLLITRISTIKHVDITIPNAIVLNSHLLNYSTSAKDKGLILNTTVTIGYDAPWVKVHALLKTAAMKTDLIDKDLEPFVLQTSLDDFFVSYQINAYTRFPNQMAVIYSDLHRNIQDAFNAGGIEIMSPHYAALRDGNAVTIPIPNKV